MPRNRNISSSETQRHELRVRPRIRSTIHSHTWQRLMGLLQNVQGEERTKTPFFYTDARRLRRAQYHFGPAASRAICCQYSLCLGFRQGWLWGWNYGNKGKKNAHSNMYETSGLASSFAAVKAGWVETNRLCLPPFSPWDSLGITPRHYSHFLLDPGVSPWPSAVHYLDGILNPYFCLSLGPTFRSHFDF